MIENNKGGLAILTGEDRFYEAWQMEIHFFFGLFVFSGED